MQSKVRLFGHAVHPMLVDFPIVCFCLLLLLDVAQSLFKLELGNVPIFLVGVGGGATVLAIVTGTIDLAFIPNRTKAHKTAFVHFLLGIVVWLWFGAASYGHTTASPTVRVAIDAAGVLLIVVQSWLGGELVMRHHIGVKSDAEGADPVALSREKKAKA
jgi:uncharacterized membrane protein